MDRKIRSFLHKKVRTSEETPPLCSQHVRIGQTLPSSDCGRLIWTVPYRLQIAKYKQCQVPSAVVLKSLNLVQLLNRFATAIQKFTMCVFLCSILILLSRESDGGAIFFDESSLA